MDTLAHRFLDHGTLLPRKRGGRAGIERTLPEDSPGANVSCNEKSLFDLLSLLEAVQTSLALKRAGFGVRAVLRAVLPQGNGPSLLFAQDSSPAASRNTFVQSAVKKREAARLLCHPCGVASEKYADAK